MTTRRFLSLWLPRLATDRARRLDAIDKRAPLAAVAKIDNAQRLVCVDAQAARLGLSLGLSLPDARARFPALIVVEAEPAEEAQLLTRLRDWCSRYTPLAALDGRDGLMLDISGVAHLFEGEAALMDRPFPSSICWIIWRKTICVSNCRRVRASWKPAVTKTVRAPCPKTELHALITEYLGVPRRKYHLRIRHERIEFAGLCRDR